MEENKKITALSDDELEGVSGGAESFKVDLSSDEKIKILDISKRYDFVISGENITYSKINELKVKIVKFLRDSSVDYDNKTEAREDYHYILQIIRKIIHNT